MMKRIPENLVTVLETGSQSVVAVAKSILESADIPCYVEGEEFQNLSAIDLDAGFVEIQVSEKHAKDARELLKHLHD
jgi:hypothetical protein